MMKRISLLLAAATIIGVNLADGKPKREKPDWSTVLVPEEGGTSFERITADNDCVNARYVGKRRDWFFSKNAKKDLTLMDWWINPQIAVSPNGDKIAYINDKNNTANIMVKNSSQGGASVQRTFRTNVMDFTWSPDGKDLCFTEQRGGHYGIYLVDSELGNVVHQISTGTDNDYGGCMSKNNRHIFFHRGEGLGSYSIWSYDRDKNLFSNYSRGMTPVPDPKNPDIFYCARFTDKKECEIWRINFRTGTEEIILSQPGRCFTTPQVSPDGEWVLVTGSSISEKEQVVNTDLFVVRTDGSQFTQLTYHPGNDLSGVWSPEGNFIYFLSQRGSADRIYNVWKMTFSLGYTSGRVITPSTPAASSSSQSAIERNTKTILNNTTKKTRR